MGKLYQRLRSDKKFRNKVLIGVIIFLFILNYQQSNELQSTAVQCESYNDIGGYIILEESFKLCESECAVQYNYNPDKWVDIGDLGWLDWLASKVLLDPKFASCKLSVETGKYVLADTKGDANIQCKSGNAVLINNNWFSKNVYKCSSGSGCKNWEKPFAGILDSIWKENKISDCSTRAYITMGAIGMMVLLVI